jgi:hypothetical protein
MADDNRMLSALGIILLRISLVIAASCIAIASIPAVIIMFIFVAFSPESLTQCFGEGTSSIRIDINMNPEQQVPPARPRRRQTSTRREHRRPSSPHPIALTAPYTWDRSDAYTPALASRHHNRLNSSPPELPAATEPQYQHYETRRSFFTNRYSGGPYTSIDPLPPARPDERPRSTYSWRGDDEEEERLPPARPDDEDYDDDAIARSDLPESRGEGLASEQQHQPVLVPIINDETDEEPLPRYERPPEYDDDNEDDVE